jgi:hypothetical protein
MGSGNLYARPANTKKNVKKGRFVRSVFFAGMLLLSMPFVSMAQPTFVHGTDQTLTVCENLGTGFNDELTITDPSFGVTETWRLVSGPSNGTSGAFPFTSTSDGGVLTTAPALPTYTPNTGFVGIDNIVVEISDGTNPPVTTTIHIVVTPLPSLNLGAVTAVCKGATTASLPFSALANVGPTSAIYNTNDSFVVPPNVNSLTFDVQGAVGGTDTHSGAPNPGNGGRVQGTLAVTGGQLLYINIGGRGGSNASTSGAPGGANGGGAAHYYFFGTGTGGGGGGATDIRVGGNSLTDRVVVAGGGGGNGWDSPGPSAGGDGGNLIAGSGGNNAGGSHAGGGVTTGYLSGSGGAHATYLGWTPGGNGAFGIGGDGSVQGNSGGGGGGYYGGGGGVWSGGGGGSSYTSPTLVSAPIFTQGYNISGGIVSINYSIPGTYAITWQSGATAAGFVSFSGSVMPPPGTSITLSLPATAPAGIYYGSFTVSNNTCTSDVYPFSVTINPIPDVDSIRNQDICNGDTSTSIFYTGSIAGTQYNWVNTQPSIGLAAAGSGDIPSFTAINSTSSPITALVTVTPVLNTCPGISFSYTLKVNPTPSLTTVLTPAAICDSTVFNYNPASATLGTTFTWFRSTTGNIADSPATGANNPNEVLYNYSPNPVNVDYLYVLAANSCLNTQTVTAIINPRPVLSSSLTPPAICNNTVFSYTPTSATSGTTFMWNRNSVPGISNTPATNANNPLETLHNTTTDSINVPYVYTLTANGCSYTQTVWVTVYPGAALSSTLAPAAICDSSLFHYTATTLTSGTTYGWSRAFTLGIGNTPQSGTTNTIDEYLVNNTANPIAVTYNFTLTSHGCGNPQSVSVVVNPKPMLNGALTPSVCDSSAFSYIPGSATAGTSFSWTRDTVTGISNAARAGINNPNDTLINTTSHTIIVTYKYNMMANGCSNTENVYLTVNPRPKLSSSLTPPAICDSTFFNYAPTSNTAGASYTWYRPYIAGIYAVAQSGTGNPNQELINSTYVSVNVTYNFTVRANGCQNTQNVIVAVNATPKLNPPYTATVCSGSPFNYVPTSYTPSTTYIWDRPAVAHVTPTANFAHTGGNGVINEILVNDLLIPTHVDYIYKLTVNNTCTNLGTQTLRVTINPAPQVPAIVIFPENITPCNHTMFQNFGAGDLQAPNVHYHWSAQNATIFSESNNGQNVLVNFDHSGTAVITVNSNVNGFGCTTSNSKSYEVGTDAAETAEVIYYNGQFVCLKNDNAAYQWGYDNANTLLSTSITGEIDQSYSNGNPDFNDNHYWCMTTKNGCQQKSYYNAPTGVTELNGGLVDMKVYPNPATQIVNVEINSAVVGELSVEVLNMLGQKIATQAVNNHKAALSVSELPAGAYLVDCYRDGVKIATTRFIKN